MNLYLISQSVNTEYDTYDSAVVAATSEFMAKNMHPRTGELIDWDNYDPDNMEYDDDNLCYKGNLTCWVTKRDDVQVQYIGKAGKDIKQGVICSSFNAG